MTNLNALKDIKLLALDVDGVLTDGKLYFSHDGEYAKTFNAQDGHGLKMLQQSGVITAIITGRTSKIVQKRAAELGIPHLMQGREDKLTALHELASKLSIPLSNIAYMGDDLPDLSAIINAGVGFAPANAVKEVKGAADYSCNHGGGEGAVREVCELIMNAQDTFSQYLENYRGNA